MLLGWAVVIQLQRARGRFPVDPFFFLIGLTYAVSVVYLATLRFAERIPVADRSAVRRRRGAGVGRRSRLTGGITSYFSSSLYLLPIIAASTMQSRRGGLQVAGAQRDLCSAARAGAVLHADGSSLAAARSARSWTDLPPRERRAIHSVVINLFGFFAVALLRGSLAERLRSARAARTGVATRSPTCRPSTNT